MPAMWGLKPACQRMWGLKSPLRKLGWSLLRKLGWSLLLLLSPPPRTWRAKSPVYPLERSGGFLTAIR